jgi:hypothetical protein
MSTTPRRRGAALRRSANAFSTRDRRERPSRRSTVMRLCIKQPANIRVTRRRSDLVSPPRPPPREIEVLTTVVPYQLRFRPRPIRRRAGVGSPRPRRGHAPRAGPGQTSIRARRGVHPSLPQIGVPGPCSGSGSRSCSGACISRRSTSRLQQPERRRGNPTVGYGHQTVGYDNQTVGYDNQTVSYGN